MSTLAWCPECEGDIEVRHEGEVTCRHCQCRYSASEDVNHDGTQCVWRLTPIEEERCHHSPAAWRECSRCSEAEGDLRYHGGL